MESLIKEKVKKKKKKNKKKRRRRRKLGDLEAWVEGLFIIFYSSYWVFSSAQVLQREEKWGKRKKDMVLKNSYTHLLQFPSPKRTSPPQLRPFQL